MRMTYAMTVAAACAVAVATTVVPRAARGADGFNAERLAAVRSTLQASIDAGALPGVVTLVWRKGELAQVNALGRRDIERGLPMAADTIFRIASMSKPITSVAALMLVERGSLSLDDPITKWVPEFATMRVLRRPDGPLDDTYAAPRAITVDDLLTHRSGLAYPYTATGPLAAALEKRSGSNIQSRLPPDEWIAALAALPLAYAPGERFHYGVSTNLLGFVVARASGTELPRLPARAGIPAARHDGHRLLDSAGKAAACGGAVRARSESHVPTHGHHGGIRRRRAAGVHRGRRGAGHDRWRLPDVRATAAEPW